MDGEVNLGDGLLLSNGANGIVDLLVATHVGVERLAVLLHSERIQQGIARNENAIVDKQSR